MVDRNTQTGVGCSRWSLVKRKKEKKRVLTTGLSAEGWYSEHSDVCRRAELPGTVEGV